MSIIWVFLGAGLGGVLRFWVSSAVQASVGSTFPAGTLLVNVSGCLLLGFVVAYLLEGNNSVAAIHLKPFLFIGLLGGYTTFSTFSIETLFLIENNQWLAAGCNIMLSIFLCILGTGLGLILGRILSTSG